MAKRRTKKEKIIARLRHQIKSQKIKPRAEQKIKTKEKVEYKSQKVEKDRQEDIFGYDPRLVNKDLRKTALLSLIFTAIIIGFWFWQRSNWWLPNFL